MAKRILVIQTAFAGDLILTLPLVQEIREQYTGCRTTVLCIPSTASLLANHPAIDEILVYDKRKNDPSLFRVVRMLRERNFDLCFLPHRSMRSAMLAFLSGIPVRIGFDIAPVRWLYTATSAYDRKAHEVLRNLSLLGALKLPIDERRRPQLFPGLPNEEEAARLRAELPDSRPYIVLAPGSVWATKRWTPEGFAAVAASLAPMYNVVFVGGKEDRALCAGIIALSGTPLLNGAGRLEFLASAALIRDAALLITNDSAPVHIASAVGTPAVVLFGATVPEFGFAPFGVPHRNIGLDGLACRPCAIHGGQRCPIATFDCMLNLDASRVIAAAEELLAGRQ